MHRTRSLAPGFLAVCLPLIVWLAGCGGSSDTDRLGGAPGVDADGPRLKEALFIDQDGNGPDEDDVLVLRFNEKVAVQGTSVEGFELANQGESFGDGAELRQSVPGSDRVEVLLGEDPDIVPFLGMATAGTKVNVAESGTGLVQVTDSDDFSRQARSSERNIPVADASASAPVLVEARHVDRDCDMTVNQGDLLVATFNKPIAVPAGATVADNFSLPVAGDSFGAGASLAAASRQSTNRGVIVILGSGAAITTAGRFSAGAAAAGSPSGLLVAASPTITDTNAALPSALSPGVSMDIEEAAATLFGNGRQAELLLGSLDPLASGVTAQGLHTPAGSDSFAGTLAVAGASFTVSFLFVADRGNDRVLIFDSFPAGTFAAASWVLGREDLQGGGLSDPTDSVDLPPSDGSLRSPGDVAFDAETNTLFVADSGNHRVLVWQDLFEVDADTETLLVRNGRAASFALGQASLGEGRANRGLAGPTGATLSSPSGVGVAADRLIVADTGNHRVLIYNSLPGSASALPAVVIGQTDFTSGAANRGGAAGAATLSSPGDAFSSAGLAIGATTGAVIVADTGNHRVLVFKTFAPSAGASADIVLGQTSFTGTASGLAATALSSPASVVADDAAALLHVADRGNNRVMAYATAGLATGASGGAIGQASASAGSPNRGGAPGAGTLSGPEGVEVLGSSLVVSDTGNHRILVYEGASLPATHRDATQVLGQTSFTGSTPGGRRLDRPVDILLTRGRLIVSDTGNHRVLIYNSVPLSGDPAPDVILGQGDAFSTLADRGGSPTAATLDLPTGLATDGTRLAVADTGNNRILIWASIPTVTGAPADVVLGQSNAATDLPNAGGAPSARTLDAPEGLATHQDRLIVADRDNHRVLIFNGFSSLATFAEADVVLGQRDFDETEPNRGGGVDRNTLRAPRDVLVGADNLYVADTGNHRVLVWDGVPGGSRRGPDGLFGQPGFQTAILAGGSPDSLAEPAGLSMDPTGELLAVADTGHHRVVFFDGVSGKSRSQRSAAAVLGQPHLFAGGDAGEGSASFSTLEAPRGLFFNGYELFAADSGASRVAVFR